MNTDLPFAFARAARRELEKSGKTFKASFIVSAWVSECVGFNVPLDTAEVISGTAFAGKTAHTHNNKTKSLTFTVSLNFMKHKTKKTTKT